MALAFAPGDGPPMSGSTGNFQMKVTSPGPQLPVAPLAPSDQPLGEAERLTKNRGG